MGAYRGYALEGSSAVELVVALYDGIIRFLSAAIVAVEQGNTEERRAAVKRALDIILHLQARLRMDIGGEPARALSEFYAAIFAQILQASQAASTAKFEHAIECVGNVREAWRQVARDPEAGAAPADAAARVLAPQSFNAGPAAGESRAASWTA
jgi:flagellar secretion chaperone FliS